MTESIAPGGVDPAEAVVYPDPTSLESLQRRAGHCAGRPCVPRCGYCGSFRQCERCEAITAQLRAERERDEARAEVERLRVIEMAARRYVVAPESCAEAREIAYYGLRRALGVETDA